jgi:hypothetical protein
LQLVKSGRADAMKINVNMYQLKTDEEKYVDLNKADVVVKAVFGGLDVVYVQRSFLELIVSQFASKYLVEITRIKK